MPDQVILPPPLQAAPRATGTSFRCDYLTDSITVLSDGRVTCGLDDPFGKRNYGNIRDQSVREIFASPDIVRLRERLASGKRCSTCHLYTQVGEGDPPPEPPPLPRRLIVETTIRCQLRCRNTCCDLNNDRSFKVRQEPFLSDELFRKLIDEVGPHLKAMYFFNYGEPFLHPRAVDMLEYARAANPTMTITTSTNGLQLARGDLADRIVANRLLDSINFTIAGYDDPSYQLYHKGGSFEQAFEGMRRLIEAKRRSGRANPWVKWRYLMFNWNDSDEQLERARALAGEAGADELRFMLCSTPLEGRSWRRAYGTPGFDAIQDILEYEQHYRTDPFGDRGLYPPENDALLGAFCWTSRRARLELRASGDRVILLLGRQGDACGHPAAARLKTPWSEQPADVGSDAWALNVISVPASHRDKPVEVFVEVDNPYIHVRHGTSDDTRELGVMVSLSFAEPAVKLEGMRLPTAHHAPPECWVESSPFRASGFSGVVPIAVLNGEYAVDGGDFGCTPAMVRTGQSVRVRHRTAPVGGMGVTTSFLIGGTLGEFTSYTRSPPGTAPAGRDEAPLAVSPNPPPALQAIEPYAIVTQLYRDLLGREPDPQGLVYWSSRIRDTGDRVAVANSLFESGEFAMRTAPAVRVFFACRSGIPDDAALRTWVKRFWAGESIPSIASVLMNCGEFVLRYAGLSDADFAERLQAEIASPPRLQLDPARHRRLDRFLEICGSAQCSSRLDARVKISVAFANMLRRRPDDSGWEFWQDQCEAGGLRRFLDVLMNTDEYRRRFAAARREEPGGCGFGASF